MNIGARVFICQKVVELILLLNKVKEEPCEVLVTVSHLISLEHMVRVGVTALFCIIEQVEARSHRF